LVGTTVRAITYPDDVDLDAKDRHRLPAGETAPGYCSTSMVQPIDALVAGLSGNGYHGYCSLITSGRKH